MKGPDKEFGAPDKDSSLESSAEIPEGDLSSPEARQAMLSESGSEVGSFVSETSELVAEAGVGDDPEAKKWLGEVEAEAEAAQERLRRDLAAAERLPPLEPERKQDLMEYAMSKIGDSASFSDVTDSELLSRLDDLNIHSGDRDGILNYYWEYSPELVAEQADVLVMGLEQRRQLADRLAKDYIRDARNGDGSPFLLRHLDRLNLPPEEAEARRNDLLEKRPAAYLENPEMAAALAPEKQDALLDNLLAGDRSALIRHLDQPWIAPERQRQLVDRLLEKNVSENDMLRLFENPNLDGGQMEKMSEIMLEEAPESFLSNVVGVKKVPDGERGKLVDRVLDSGRKLTGPALLGLYRGAENQDQRERAAISLAKADPDFLKTFLREIDPEIKSKVGEYWRENDPKAFLAGLRRFPEYSPEAVGEVVDRVLEDDPGALVPDLDEVLNRLAPAERAKAVGSLLTSGLDKMQASGRSVSDIGLFILYRSADDPQHKLAACQRMEAENPYALIRRLPEIDQETRVGIRDRWFESRPDRLLDHLDSFPDMTKEQVSDLIDRVTPKNPDLVFARIMKLPVTPEQAAAAAEACLSASPAEFLKHAERNKFEFEGNPRLDKLVKAAARLNLSPSNSVQRIKEQVLFNIKNLPDPEATLVKVEDIFVRNNLPDFGKHFRTFEVLYDDSRIEQMLGGPADPEAEQGLSPTLKAQSRRGRRLTVYKDLLNINLEAGEPSLRSYLEVLRDGQALFDRVDAGEGLSPPEEERFDLLTKRLGTLYETSMLGRVQGAEPPAAGREAYDQVRRSLGLKPGEKLNQRVAEMFLKPIGVDSIDAALDRSRSAKAEADARNRELAKSGNLPFQAGDLLRGFSSEVLGSVLDRGSVAREYLGAGSDSDKTPFDADCAQASPKMAAEGISKTIDSTIGAEYGDVVMLIRDRGQFQRTAQADSPRELGRIARERSVKPELFKTGVLGGWHYGIRTGVSPTQIDALVYHFASTEKVESGAMEVAAHGNYIPIASKDGKVLFSPEDYDSYRARFFNGLDGEFKYKESALESSPAFQEELQAMVEAKRLDREKAAGVNSQVRSTIREVLADKRIQSVEGASGDLERADIYDTGSSSRETNVPGSYDFDFVVKLNSQQMRSHEGINQDMVNRFGGQTHEWHRADQLRLLGSPVGGEMADIDVAFVSKGEVQVYESHQAVKDRLEAARRDLGEEGYERITANIVLAKKLLKDSGCYKKGASQQGGLGGIGVENWVLANGGSVLSAMESFEAAAFDGKKMLSLDEFVGKYPIMDPGVNAKGGGHDNFTRILTPDGYRKMAEAVRSALDKLRQSPDSGEVFGRLELPEEDVPPPDLGDDMPPADEDVPPPDLG